MARLIYGEYESDTIAPVIAIDLERHLYSQYSFLYEIGGLINHIVAAHPINKDTRSFDFYSQDNHCPSCSGRLQIEVFDKDIAIQDKSVPFWDGLFDQEIMKVLKFYQHEKIEFLFEEIKMSLVTICQRAIMICQKKKSIRFGTDILKNHFMIKRKDTQNMGRV